MLPQVKEQGEQEDTVKPNVVIIYSLDFFLRLYNNYKIIERSDMNNEEKNFWLDKSIEFFNIDKKNKLPCINRGIKQENPFYKDNLNRRLNLKV